MSIKLVRGDTNRLNIYVRRRQLDAEGEPVRGPDGNFTHAPVNLTNATLTLTARDTKTGVVSFTLSNTGGGIQVSNPPTAGDAVATIANAVTEDYEPPTWLDYDIELIESDLTKTTVAKDRFVVVRDVTP